MTVDRRIAAVTGSRGAIEATIHIFAPYQDVSLDAWCRANRLPYLQIAAGGVDDTKSLQFPGAIPSLDFTYTLPPMYAGRADNVRILPPSGYMTTSDQKVIFRGLVGIDGLPEINLGRYFNRIDGANHYVIDASDARNVVEPECIYVGGQLNFGHFIYENLARLSLLNWLPDLQRLPVAIYDDLPQRYLEFFDHYGFAKQRRILVPRREPSLFRRVWRLSSPMYRKSRKVPPLFWPDALWAMRSTVAHLMRPLPMRRPRYYLTRPNAQWRRLANEAQVLTVLDRFGVQPIDLSSATAATQIATISEAELVIGTAGAGPAITLYAPTDCLMIELTCPKFEPIFSMFGYAALMDRPFKRITGRRATPEQVSAAGLPPNTGSLGADADFVVNVDSLATIMRAADDYLKNQSTRGAQ
ncbi:MAG: glycosyltransferase family 61 protein [Alphaproteobacteria bacterium]|nr:glycosyltransferase family 61 protein [Alphaproteobacteria bacterium]